MLNGQNLFPSEKVFPHERVHSQNVRDNHTESDDQQSHEDAE